MVMVATPPSGRRPSRTRRTGTGLLCALMLSGCSYSYLDQSGARQTVVIDKHPDDDVGLEFAETTFDGTRLCNNTCFFCFLKGLPKGR